MVKAKKKYGFEPDYAIPPGDTLREVIETQGMSQKDLADRLGMNPVYLNRIFSGELPISQDTAQKLKLVTGVPTHFWISLEGQYRMQLALLKSQEQLADEQADLRSWVERFNYASYARAGWVQRTNSWQKKYDNLLAFFKVAGPDQWESFHLAGLNEGAYRKSPSVQEKDEDTTAWIQRGQILAQSMPAATYDQARFKAALDQVRTWVPQDPVAVLPQIEAAFADAGVKLVILPQLPGMGVHGYTRWIKNQALILHGLRQKTNDLFWFDLFHEAAHILKHAKHGKKPIIEHEDCTDKHEMEADQWAAGFLIPTTSWRKFADGLSAQIGKTRIRAFAKQHRVHTGIVTGRLSREDKLSYTAYTDLKIFLKERISEMETRPSKKRMQYKRLGTLRNKLKRNQGKPIDLEEVRRHIGRAYADLRH